MRPRLRFILLGLAAFLIALLVVFPAAWIKSFLPAQVRCASLAGSIWRGQCNDLALAQPGKPALRLDSVNWRLRPLALLQARLRADVAVTGANLAARGELTLRSGGRMHVESLDGSLALDHARLAALPAGWTTQAEARDLSMDVADGRITAVGGALLARQLRDSRGTAFGDFRLQFPRQEAPPFRGTLSDEAAAVGAARGPLQLQSQLTVNADMSWQLKGTVMLRPGSPPQLGSALDQLAPVDLNGVRSFSLEGTAD
ncbi:MAG: type II secretion system protein N [Steroidobacteraceae bacterium]